MAGRLWMGQNAGVSNGNQQTMVDEKYAVDIRGGSANCGSIDCASTVRPGALIDVDHDGLT